tara:strand:+ start:83 stop:922 length:840 start_codon:yes stop_codon:yes gene_type:complete
MTEELNLKEMFSSFVKFNIKHKKLLLVSVVVGVLSVILFQKFKPAYYKTQAICMSGIAEYERQEQIEDLSQRTAIDLINHLDINIENEDYSSLSILLGLEEDIVKKIKKIEAEQLYQQDMQEKFYALNKFEVSLVIYDNTKISDIQNGLLYYFENNEFVKNYHQSYLESNINLIRDIDGEIKLLRDIRIEGAKNNLEVSSVNFMSSKDGKELSNQIVSLSHLREEIKINQILLRPLVYVQEFANVSQKEDDISVPALLAGIFSFIIGMLFSLIKDIREQ